MLGMFLSPSRRCRFRACLRLFSSLLVGASVVQLSSPYANGTFPPIPWLGACIPHSIRQNRSLPAHLPTRHFQAHCHQADLPRQDSLLPLPDGSSSLGSLPAPGLRRLSLRSRWSDDVPPACLPPGGSCLSTRESRCETRSCVSLLPT